MDTFKIICKELFVSSNTKLYMAGLAFFLAVLLTGNQHSTQETIQPIEEPEETKTENKPTGVPQVKVTTFKEKLFRKIIDDYCNNNNICTHEDENTTKTQEETRKTTILIKKNAEGTETTSYIVIYIPVLLLQISLILSIFEIFKDRKGKKEKVNQKPALNRTCSLADITLMRHQRRESMRKDFGHQEHQDSRFSSKQIADGDYHSFRRCSVPVGPGVVRKPSVFSSRSFDAPSTDPTGAVDDDIEPPRERRRSHMRLLHRH